MRLASAAALFLILATPAFAQDNTRTDIVRGLCQKSGCDEFSVMRVDRVRADQEGTLFRTRVRTYHASSQGRSTTGEEQGYVFCSPTKPTILAEQEGKVAGLQIATAPTQESRETIRHQANFYAMYFTICHGPEAGRAAAQDLEGVARQYGYRSPIAKSVTVSLAHPEEVFSRPPQQMAGRDDGRILPDRPLREGQSEDLVPPRPVPHLRDRGKFEDRYADRQGERFVERRMFDEEDDVIVIERRRSADARAPWYREPQRWIESINPF